jgi:predicted nucleotide-binding protein
MYPRLKQKPALFIGSSVESLEVAYALEECLGHDAWVTVWQEGLFEPSRSTLEVLLEILPKMDFGLFVFSPDDVVRIRGRQHPQVRDNVLFELGLFVGALGRERSILVTPANSGIRLPTDLAGMTPVTYDPNRPDGNLVAAIGNASNTIRRQIKKLGFRRGTPSQSAILEALEKVVKQIQQDGSSLSINISKLESVRTVSVDHPRPSRFAKPSRLRVKPMK